MSLWAIAYDLNTTAIRAARAANPAEPTVATVYNRIRREIMDAGFQRFTQLSIYSMEEEENSLRKVIAAVRRLRALPENQYIRRLHVFRIDGALHDVLPEVAADDRESEGAPVNDDAAAAEIEEEAEVAADGDAA